MAVGRSTAVVTRRLTTAYSRGGTLAGCSVASDDIPRVGGMGRIRGHYEWDDDRLSPGRKREGGLHQNLFDEEGRLAGNARFVPDDDDGPAPYVITETVYVPVEERRRSRQEEELAEAIAALVSHFIGQGIARARPHAEQWWRESARPAIDAQRAKLAERSRRRRRSPEAGVTGSTVVRESRAATDARTDGRPRMSRAEAQARFLAALAARAYSDEQMRLVDGADIVDGEDVADVQQSLAQLPPEQVRALIEAMATDPSLLGEEMLAELASLLGRRAL